MNNRTIEAVDLLIHVAALLIGFGITMIVHDNDYLDDTSYLSIYEDAKEITAILVSIVKTSKESL